MPCAAPSSRECDDHSRLFWSGPEDEPFEEPLTALAELKRQGLIRHIGLSTVSPQQLAEAQAITEIVCIQLRCWLPVSVIRPALVSFERRPMGGDRFEPMLR